MGEWRHDPTDHEHTNHAAHRPSAKQFCAEIQDVLCKSETGGYRRRVHDAVDWTVEVFSRGEKQNQHAEALDRLLHDWRLNHRAEKVAVAGRSTEAVLNDLDRDADEQRDKDRGDRAPEETEDQKGAGLPLPAVYPSDAEQDRGKRHERHEASNRHRAGSEARDEKCGNEQPGDSDQHEGDRRGYDEAAFVADSIRDFDWPWLRKTRGRDIGWGVRWSLGQVGRGLRHRTA